MNKLTPILEKQNMREIARRMTAAGYPIKHATLSHWKTGKSLPRVDRLQLAERVVRETDPEVADIIVEILSTMSVYNDTYQNVRILRQCKDNAHIEYSTENENVK